MADSSRFSEPKPGGSRHGRLGLLTVLLLVVVLAMWLVPKFIRYGSPPAAPTTQPARGVRIVPPPTRPATVPTSLPAQDASLTAALTGVRDGSGEIEPAAVAALRRRADHGVVLPVSHLGELTPAHRGRWVQLVGTLEEVPRFSTDPASGHPQGLARLRLRERGGSRDLFEVWLPLSAGAGKLKLFRTHAYRVTGLYYKIWNTGSFELDPHAQQYRPPVVAPVLIASAEGVTPVAARAAAPSGPLGLSNQVWVLLVAAVLIVGYIIIRVMVSARSRERRAAGGERPGGLFRLPPRRPTPAAPAREPADEKKLDAARDALELAERVDAAPTLPVHTAQHDYRIHIAPGLLGQAGDLLAKLFGKPRHTALITDEHVGPLFADAVRVSLEKAGFKVTVLTVPAGEASKDIAEAAKLYAPMLAAEMDRDALVVALGGGMIGDLGGFVAATFMRGIDFVQVPTSLLAQVDASVGGKVAVNLPEGKNLVGAFHQPRAVIIDIRTLASLPDAQYAAGLAEVVKHGVIRDEALFMRLVDQREQILARDEEVMADIVAANCRIKASVVSADEKESGVRAILNYGHTVGHALESLGHYALSHGAAVSLGMIAASHIAEAKGLIGEAQTSQQRELLAAFGLPVTLGEVDADKVLAIMRHDKKARGGRLRFVLPTRIGRVEIFDDVTDEQIRDALAALKPA